MLERAKMLLQNLGKISAGNFSFYSGLWVQHEAVGFSCLFGLSSYLRYPYEAIRVVTNDGYVLLLERIPRYNIS